jgi:hypothetical protein
MNVPGSPNYVSRDGNYIATYKHSYGGHATYCVHRTESRKTMNNTLSVGGLPTHISCVPM